MSKEEVLRITRELIAAPQPFVLATVDAEGRPQIRWMGGNVCDDPLVIWMACGAGSRKMAQVRAHPAAELMFHDEKFSTVATIVGECAVVDDLESKRRLWEAMPILGKWLSGPEDPGFGVIRFVGQRVELLDLAKSMAPEAAEV